MRFYLLFADRRTGCSAKHLAVLYPILPIILISMTSGKPSPFGKFSGELMDTDEINNVMITDEGRMAAWEKESKENMKRTNVCHDFSQKETCVPEPAIPVKIKQIGEEYSVIKKNVEESKEQLGKIRTTAQGSSCYEVLKSFLMELRNVLYVWSQANNQKEPVDVCFAHLTMELQEDTIARFFDEKLKIFETVLTKRYQKFLGLNDLCYDSLEVQVFRIISFLVKHELIRSENVTKWMNAGPTLTLLTNHINRLSSPRYFLAYKLEESIKRSPSCEHFGMLLKFLNQKTWEHIDYQHLERNIRLMKELNFTSEPGFIGVIMSFLEAGFDKMNSEITQNQRNALKNLLIYFHSNQNNLVSKKKAEEHLSMVYQILNYIRNFKKTLLSQYFPDSLSENEFHQKWFVLENSRGLVHKSREICSMTIFGLLSTEVDATDSKHLITFEDAQNFSWNFKPSKAYFEESFRMYIESDRKTWYKKYEKMAEVRNLGQGKHAENVFSYIFNWTNEERKPFGTNFLINHSATKSTSKNQIEPSMKLMLHSEPIGFERRISALFLKEIYEWTYHQKIMIDEFQIEQHKLFKKLQGMLLSECKEEVELKNWISNSNIMLLTEDLISVHLKVAQNNWERLREKLEIINTEIINSNQPSKTEEVQDDYSEKVHYKSENADTCSEMIEDLGSSSKNSVTFPKKGLNLPQLNFI